ncbi:MULTISPECIES: TIGR02391 family protein [unclassified Streptomyces]|uniref:TIGR02391 family protein n=1 Tax=unclassified Streptomyces TaxID=2593676 RepID=UPI00073C1AB7|nr:TIGR02391 family protein [Streptomyces sp. AVP053U2]ODA74025.1 hypothetical protein APS67_001568 [Streptomyces sp. AVP053U2]
MSINVSWARAERASFLKLIELYSPPDSPGMTIFSSRLANRGGGREIVASAQVVEQIPAGPCHGGVPRFLTTAMSPSTAGVSTAKRSSAPTPSCCGTRRFVSGSGTTRLGSARRPCTGGMWDGARSLWRSGHFREAVTAAARKVNAETQNKVGCRDVSETALFQSVFSKDAAKSGQPRLRLMADDSSDTFRRVHRGAMSFAEGCFAGIRNPNSHEDGLPELPEHEALEQLAAFGVLARWVDSAAVDAP